MLCVFQMLADAFATVGEEQSKPRVLTGIETVEHQARYVFVTFNDHVFKAAKYLAENRRRVGFNDFSNVAIVCFWDYSVAYGDPSESPTQANTS